MSEAIRERFEIDSDQKAEWALQKIKEARSDRDRWVKFYETQIEKVKYECNENTATLESMLQGYFDRVPHRETKTQSAYDLPGGKLVLKKQGPEFECNDEQLVPWLEENAPEFVKVKKSSDWGNFKKTVAIFNGLVVDENGEVVPGITVTERPDKFTVEIKKEG